MVGACADSRGLILRYDIVLLRLVGWFMRATPEDNAHKASPWLPATGYIRDARLVDSVTIDSQAPEGCYNTRFSPLYGPHVCAFQGARATGSVLPGMESIL